MKSIIKVTILVLLMVSCNQEKDRNGQEQQENDQITSKEYQDSIIDELEEKGVWKLGLFSRERQELLSQGLAKDSTISFLWQQKAMPLFKQGKYELGMKYLDKAVKFDTNNEWQEYRAFMKCIFAKTYEDAIIDFEDCKKKNGNSYVMDHSYNFYIALSKIQLNEYQEAEVLLEKEVNEQFQNRGEKWVHHLDLFYLGISRYEQGKYEDAIKAFDRSLQRDPHFSDALYYKAKCEGRLGHKEESKRLLKEAKKYGKQGNSINEDNSFYERYPYQVRWELWD